MSVQAQYEMPNLINLDLKRYTNEAMTVEGYVYGLGSKLSCRPGYTLDMDCYGWYCSNP